MDCIEVRKNRDVTLKNVKPRITHLLIDLVCVDLLIHKISLFYTHAPIKLGLCNRAFKSVLDRNAVWNIMASLHLNTSYFGDEKLWTRHEFLHQWVYFHGKYLVPYNNSLIDIRFKKKTPKVFVTPFLMLKKVSIDRGKAFLTVKHNFFIRMLQNAVLKYMWTSCSRSSLRLMRFLHFGRDTIRVECDSKFPLDELETFTSTKIKLKLALRLQRTRKGVFIHPYVVEICDIIY